MALDFITQEEFPAILKQHPLVFVIFGASWCGNCEIMKPIFTNFAENHQKEAFFAQIDAQKAEKLTEEYDILSLPVILIFKDGQLLKRIDGIVSAKTLMAQTEGLF